MFGASDDQVKSTRELSVRELNAMIPRKVSLNPDGGYAIVVFIIMFVGIGAIWFGALSYATFQKSRHRDALNKDGREAMAKVIELTNNRAIHVRYTFRSGGADYEGVAELDNQIAPRWPDGRVKHVREGDQIRIVFLPSDPSINYPIDWVWWSLWDLGPYLFMLFFSGIGVVTLVYMIRERRLARIGWVTEGKVIACAPRGSRFRVDYEFYSEDHQEFDGANDRSEEYGSGANIRVIYLRKNPKRNDTYPLSTFRTVGE
jgi:uncharacterized protein DUF3592